MSFHDRWWFIYQPILIGVLVIVAALSMWGWL